MKQVYTKSFESETELVSFLNLNKNRQCLAAYYDQDSKKHILIYAVLGQEKNKES